MSWYDELIDELARDKQGELDPVSNELSLWSLVNGTKRAEARTRRHLIGIELVVIVDGSVRNRVAFRPADLALLKAASETLRLAFEAKGWKGAGPRPIR